jgi:hypothetical protein
LILSVFRQPLNVEIRRRERLKGDIWLKGRKGKIAGTAARHRSTHFDRTIAGR